MNWVERKFARERNLGQAADVWSSVVAAVRNAVDSFKVQGKYGTAKVIRQNDYCVLVEVEQPQQESAHFFTADRKRYVRIAFEHQGPSITVTLDADAANTFHMEADETRCFLKHGVSELSPDEFSKLALEEAFFKPKALPKPSTAQTRWPRRGSSQWT